MKRHLSILAAALVCLGASAQTAVFSEDFNGMYCNSSTGIGNVTSPWTAIGDGMANDTTYANRYGMTSDSWFYYTISETNIVAMTISWKQQAVASDRWLITPAITMPTTAAPAGSTYALSFQAYGSSDQYPEELDIRVSTTGTDKADFTSIRTLSIGESNGGAFLVPLTAYVGQTIYIAFVNQGDGYYTMLDNVSVDAFANTDIYNVGTDALTFQPTGNNSFSFTVYNMGLENLTTFDYSYTVNGGAPVSGSVSGINVPYYSSHTETVNLNHATAEPLTVEVTVSSSNGVTASNDYLVSNTSYVIYDPANATQRTTLLEHFTTGRCTWCPVGHQILTQAIEPIDDKVAWVAHHVGYYTDNMTIASSDTIAALYGNNGTWAPAMMIDRDKQFAEGQAGVVGNVPIPNNQSYLPQAVTSVRNTFNTAIAKPAMATIEFTSFNYNEQTRQLTATVEGQFNARMNFPAYSVSFYLTEDSIVASQVGPNAAWSAAVTTPNYVHNHVLRECIGGAWGNIIAMNVVNPSEDFSQSVSFTLPASYRPEKCRLVAFVNILDQYYTRQNVLNACKSDYLAGTASIRTAEEASIEVKTWPNPATEMAYITAESTIRSIQVVNTLGQTVVSRDNVNADVVELRASELEPGLYIVTIRTDNGSASQRLTVVR